MPLQAGNSKLRENDQCFVKCFLSTFEQWDSIPVIIAVLAGALEWRILSTDCYDLWTFSATRYFKTEVSDTKL